LVSLSYQASSSTLSDDLVALPEHRNPLAYDSAHLGGARFPWTLPLDLSLTEVRAYLERARTSRLELMETLDPEARLADPAVAREVLGLSGAQVELITKGPVNSDQRWRDWGLEVKGARAVIRDASVDKEVKDTPLGLLGRASILLQQSRPPTCWTCPAGRPACG
jgi:hypothetical protein